MANSSLWLLLPLLPACAQAPIGTLDAAIGADEIRGHVAYLASDRLEGRRAGSGMDLRAADYLADCLARAGLEPAGDGGGWFQDFEIPLPPAPGDCALSWSGGDWEDVGTVQATASASATGPLVAAGYGLVIESHGTNDYADLGVAGKVVLVRRYTMFGPQADPQFAALGNLRGKIRGAAEAGAIAMILGTHPEDLEKGGEAEIDFADVPGTMSIPVVTVSPERFAQLEAACGGEGGVLAEPVTVRAAVRTGSAITRNVLALAPGTGPEVVVVGAHYDHLGWGGEGSLAPGERAVHNGADDNASGTALTLELAERIALERAPRERGVLFAFWGAEEAGLYGSLHWVKEPTLPLERVVCNVNLDMVGRLEGGAITVGSAATAAGFAPALAAAEAALARDRAELGFEITVGESPGGGGSDHMSFHGVKIPALFFFSGLHADYHKPSDDADKLDYPRMAALGSSLVELIDALAEEPRADLAWVAPVVAPDAKERTVSAARVWFGSIPDYTAQPEGGGMQIAGTSPGGPAEKAGLVKGDVIKKIGERAIADIYDFMDSLAAFTNGDSVDVHILRDGQPLSVKLTFFPRSAGD